MEKNIPENDRWICRTQISHSLQHVCGFVLEGDTPLSHFHTNYKHKYSPHTKRSDYERYKVNSIAFLCAVKSQGAIIENDRALDNGLVNV